MAGAWQTASEAHGSPGANRPGGVASRPAFLRLPPFPGASVHSFAELGDGDASFDVDHLAAILRRHRVGGTFWSAQPDLPAIYVLVRSSAARDAAERSFPNQEIVVWTAADGMKEESQSALVIVGECDPWHMLSAASAVVLDDDDDELSLIATLLGVRCYTFDSVSGMLELRAVEGAESVVVALSGKIYENPFTNGPMTARETVELCGFWRRLIDSNRDITAGVGFALWKQRQISPLLWNGSQSFKFLRNVSEVERQARVAVWRAKASPRVLADIVRKEISVIEVEDGFLRSRGLGADCVPPQSITVDRLGAYFDPSQPSELERLLEQGRFDEALLSRARSLRSVIVNAGLGKYDCGFATLERPSGDRRCILVPGQVEDDRAVQTGGCGLVSNLELLRRVRSEAPEAYIVYKPHPDVLAGHRHGLISDHHILEFADEIVTDVSMASLIDMIDEVHVNTSLAGFEALLREKPVTTYGVPFYSGWGLTRDLGPVPSRRTARRTLDELVAAILLLYPRYIDPETGLPCPAEIVAGRLAADQLPDTGVVVGMRRLQGKFMRRLRSLVQ